LTIFKLPVLFDLDNMADLRLNHFLQRLYAYPPPSEFRQDSRIDRTSHRQSRGNVKTMPTAVTMAITNATRVEPAIEVFYQLSTGPVTIDHANNRPPRHSQSGDAVAVSRRILLGPNEQGWVENAALFEVDGSGEDECEDPARSGLANELGQ